MKPCETCGGRGELGHYAPTTCPTCKGKGIKPKKQTTGRKLDL